MRRVRRKGGNKEKVFGCDLLEHLTASSQGIPLVLRCCSEFVEQHGIVDGIYRLSGVSSNIQKLRGEFESDGSPDLNKDLYLQDIHCVSSLCKAYFRELPNPLLTYQLYDKFAEAVAIQLEEERLVKIKDVLKELPAPHYRTLEFLMRHLVKMASYSSETNMHARNLAIVWAPNLLRSKDIEASGFNGTAAFMEVRVQSIVVEFILTHVPQLFPDEGVSSERRKSLPSPSAMPSQEVFFRSPQPNFGNISPGDGPLPIRPYHAIIEGTDKRKGSLKGRKWMSIFNIGGRIQDQRRRHKHSAKEKERPALRPARSMDSLSTPSFPNEVTRSPGQRSPSTSNSPLATAPAQAAPDAAAPSGGLGSSEYAVTYRRGTGLVSGSAGTPGTYTALDPEGLGLPVIEGVQTRSPGVSSKAARRAAMHITGPTLVTVPLHITSNLALGVLQGGGSDRIILRGKDKEGGDKVKSKEKREKIERKECRAMEWNVEESRKVEEEEKKHNREKEVVDVEGKKEGAGGVSEGKDEEAGEKPDEEVNDERVKQEPAMAVQDASRKQRATSVNCKAEDNDEDAEEEDQDSNSSEYTDMKGEERHPGNDGAFDASHILNSTEVEGDDHELSGYVQDNFDFLDQMDCSVMDHIDTSVSCQVNEFSVEPPGHSDDEYEIMKEGHPSQPAGLQETSQLSPDMHTWSQTEAKPQRPLSLDLPSRHTKSLSLPYMTSPVRGPEESFSDDEEVSEDDSDDNLYYNEEDDDSVCIQSLPSDFFLNNLPKLKQDTDSQDCSPDTRPVCELQSPEAEKCLSLNRELSACETTCGDQGQTEADAAAEEDELEEKLQKEDEEAHRGRDQLETNMQSRATEEHPSFQKDAQSETSLTPDASATCFEEEFPLHSNENNVNTVTANKVEEMAEIPPTDSPLQVTPSDTLRESADAPSEESSDTSVIPAEREDRSQQSVLEMESDENVREELGERGGERTALPNHEGCKEQDSSVCTDSDIWNELEDVVCEVIEDEEGKQCEEEAVAAEAHSVEGEEEKEQRAGASREKSVEVDESESDRVEEEESLDKTEEDVMQEEKEEQEMHVFSEEAEPHSRGEVASKETEENKQKADVQREQPSVDKPLPVIRSDIKELKGNQRSHNTDDSLAGVDRKLVTSKHPKVYQVKAVPVVPPKPQHCKITALTLRQQQQQRERRYADRGSETARRASTELHRVLSAEQLRDDDGADRKERPVLLRERERKRDGAEGAARDTSRNSPLSMCFDEAVAIATLRREKERVREGEAEAEGSGK